MAEFLVTVRRDYRDIAGLALDLRAQTVLDDGSGFLSKWTNVARARKVASARPRYADALPFGAAPFIDLSTIGTLYQNALQQGTRSLLQSGAIAATRDFSVAFQSNFSSNGATKTLLSSGDGSFKLYQKCAAFQAAYEYNGTQVNTATAINGAGVYIFVAQGGTAVLNQNNTINLLSGAFANVDLTDLIVGNNNASAQGAEGSIYSMRVWDRPLTAQEQDFAYQSLDRLGGSLAVAARATVVVRTWEDLTGTTAAQPRRINPLPGIPMLYLYAYGVGAVQMACEVGAEVLPDSALGGALFSASVVEQPLGSTPVVFTRDAGWSSVFDVTMVEDGHYSILFSRAGLGAKLVHIDKGSVPPS